MKTELVQKALMFGGSAGRVPDCATLFVHQGMRWWRWRKGELQQEQQEPMGEQEEAEDGREWMNVDFDVQSARPVHALGPGVTGKILAKVVLTVQSVWSAPQMPLSTVPSGKFTRIHCISACSMV